MRVLPLLLYCLLSPYTSSSCLRDPDELQTLLALAADGDSLTICDGDYHDWDIEIGSSGVRLQAETAGGVSFQAGSTFVLKGDRNTLSGIKMHGGGHTEPINVGHWLLSCAFPYLVF